MPPAPPIKGTSEGRGHTSQTSRKGREREAVTEHLSGLVGEAKQEGGGGKSEAGSGRETLDHRSGGPDRQRPARAGRALSPEGLFVSGVLERLTLCQGHGAKMAHVPNLRPTERN